MDLSIIVPVYQVEKYVRPCMESIFKQGIDDNRFEVIIINDGTKDKSMEMIADIINQHKNITIINQENQGLSVARNNGIAAAKGEYILMPDSDDLLLENSLKPLVEKALETKADLIVADFFQIEEDVIYRIQDINQKDFGIKEKTGKQLFLEYLNPYECFVWRTLYRREFIIQNHLKFYPRIRYQDIPFTHECYLKAKKCLRISWYLNIYRKWSGASTRNFNENKARDFCTAIAKTWELRHLKEITPETDFKLREDIWASFSVMICSTCHDVKEKSRRFSIIDFMKKEAPGLDFNNGIKQRFISFLYRNMPHTYIQTRYLYSKVIENKLRPLFHNMQTKYTK